jgi:uncharacterized protein (DUF1697 family)
MPRFVVLLRGVNVGKSNRVPMAELRSLLEELGNDSVRTLLNSGNAVFSSTGRSDVKHSQAIASALLKRLGVAVPVVVKSASSLAAAVSECPNPPSEDEYLRFLVAFAQEPKALTELGTLESLVQPGESFVIGSHAAYLHCPNGILESRAASALLGKVGRGVATRNWSTVLKLEALASASAG